MRETYNTLSDLINCEYLESDIPELLIIENGHIENITKAILETTLTHLEPYLKKSFENKKDEIIKQIVGSVEEDYCIIEKVRCVLDNLLNHIDNSDGELKIDNNSSGNSGRINKLWELPKEKQILK